MTIQKFEDWIDDERFVTKAQKLNFLETGIAPKGNPKKSIEKRFLEHYTSFKFLRKKKGEVLEIELGDLRNKPLNLNKKSDSLNDDIACLLMKKINEDERDELYLTSSAAFRMINLVNNVHMSEDEALSTESEFNYFFYNQFKYLTSSTFKAVNKRLKMKMQYMRIDKYEIEVNKENKKIASFSAFDEDESKKIDDMIEVLKLQNVTRKFGQDQEWKKMMNEFVADEFDADGMYTAYDAKTATFNHDYDVDFSEVKKGFLDKLIRSVITREFNIIVKYNVCKRMSYYSDSINFNKCSKELDRIERSKVAKLALDGKLVDRFLEKCYEIRYVDSIEKDEFLVELRRSKMEKINDEVEKQFIKLYKTTEDIVDKFIAEDLDSLFI